MQIRNKELIKTLYKEEYEGLSNEQFLVKEIVKMQVFFAAEVRRVGAKNTGFRQMITYRDLEKIILKNSTYATYGEAARNLKENIQLFSRNEYLKKSIFELEQKVISSNIKNLRFGLAPSLTKEEHDLDTFMMRVRFLFLDHAEIKKISEVTGIKISTIKQACQSERLLNTQKVGATWMASLHEVKQYWRLGEDI